MRITFSLRAKILDPVAVAGVGRPARALANRLLHLTDAQLRELRGAAGEDLLVVLGETSALPWADGVAYLGRDPDAPRLLVPTMVRPDISSRSCASATARPSSAWRLQATSKRRPLSSPSSSTPARRRSCFS